MKLTSFSIVVLLLVAVCAVSAQDTKADDSKRGSLPDFSEIIESQGARTSSIIENNMAKDMKVIDSLVKVQNPRLGVPPQLAQGPIPAAKKTDN